MTSASQPSNSTSVLLLLAVAALAAWNGWLTWENLQMKKALGTDGGDLAAKVQSLEATVENGLVLSLIDPASDSVLISNPLKPVTSQAPEPTPSVPGKAAPPPLEPGPGVPPVEPGPIEAGPRATPSSEPEEDPSKPFDFTTGGVTEKDPKPPANDPGPEVLIGPQLPELPPDHSVPASVANVRDPAPSSGTFGESRPVVAGGGERNILDLTITDVFGNNVVAIDGGARNGVQSGTRFAIVRGGKEIGRLEIQEVSETHSAAEILEYTGGLTIRAGDRVTPIRK